MEKPEKKRVVAIDYKAEPGYWVSFYANATVTDCAREFGSVEPAGGITDKWLLTVDKRYDFDEVVAWLESFNS